MIRQVFRPLRRAVRREILWCGAQQARAVGDLARDQAGVGRDRQADGHVHRFPQQVQQVIGEAQPDVELRVARDEAGHQGGEDTAAEAQRGGDAQIAARCAASVGHHALGVRQRRQHLLAGLVEGRHPARSAAPAAWCG